MVSRVVDTALVRRTDHGLWSVTCIEYPRGLALLHRDGPLNRVLIGDSPNAVRLPGDPDAYSAATWTPDGELAVTVQRAPPGILVGPTGCRTSPDRGEARDWLRPRPGERLLLLSCAAFDRMPETLAQGITASPPGLSERGPEELLLEIFRDVGCGAGAIIDRLPAPSG